MPAIFKINTSNDARKARTIRYRPPIADKIELMSTVNKLKNVSKKFKNALNALIAADITPLTEDVIGSIKPA